MEFTKYLLNNLVDSGRDICIYSNEISKILKGISQKNFDRYSKTSYYFWIKKERPIPLKVIIKIMNFIKLDKINIESFSIYGGNKIIFPDEQNIFFCYLLGLILGDGCLVHNKKGDGRNTYLIKITFRELDEANKIEKVIRKLFEIKSSIYPGRGCYDLCIYSKPLVLILNKKYQMPIGKKYGSICVPRLIFNGNDKMKKAFLRGVFDSDGNIYLHRAKKSVQLRQKSDTFLKEMKKLFGQLDINFNDPYYDKANNSWVLWSSKKELVDTFINKIIDFKVGMPG